MTQGPPSLLVSPDIPHVVIAQTDAQNIGCESNIPEAIYACQLLASVFQQLATAALQQWVSKNPGMPPPDVLRVFGHAADSLPMLTQLAAREAREERRVIPATHIPGRVGLA